MREILFRGKRVDNGEWVYGNFIEDKWGDDNGNTVYAILQDRVAPDIAELWTPVKVIPETVGEYTGLKDKNGKKIFEGDIVKTWSNNIGKIEFGQYWDEETEVDFYGYAWIGKDEYGESITLSLNKCWNGHEVIGTIYDNPELLEVEE